MNISIFGSDEPIFSSTDMQQMYSDTCAIKSQQLILESFGVNISEEELVNEALALQIYQPGYGTPITQMGSLLELHGVESTYFESANKYTLMHELAQGHQVMVAVDSGELWTPSFWEQIKDVLFGSTPNHALIVTGIDTSNPEAVEVILSDPGTGAVMRYPYEQFADAWSDSSFTMLATNESPTEIENGFLDSIMGMDSTCWLQTFGEMIEDGVEVAKSVVDFLNDNPEIMVAVTELVPLFLANHPEAAVPENLPIEGLPVDIV